MVERHSDNTDVYPSLAPSENWYFEGESVVAAALVFDEVPLHVTAFSPATPYSSASATQRTSS